MFIQDIITNTNGKKESIYDTCSRQKAQEIPDNYCFWEFLTERLEQQDEIPGIELFDIKGYQISRADFIERSKRWAKAFFSLGVKEGEIVPFFGLNLPDMAAAAGGLNLINAVPYFLRPDSSRTAIAAEAQKCRFAVVFGAMWERTDGVFDNYEKVIVVSITDCVEHSWLLKTLASFKTRHMLQSVPKNKSNIIRTNPFLATGDQVDFEVIDRIKHHADSWALITSSSGTTDKSINKGIVATNGSIIASLLQAENAKPEYHYGRRCFSELPFAFATAFDIIFLLPLYMGQTVVSHLRINVDALLENAITAQSNVLFYTGSSWGQFFQQVEKAIASGNTPDLSFLDMPIMGGDGSTPTKVLKWNALLSQCGCKVPIFCGYGLSELFSVISVDTIRATREKFETNPIISVGFPLPGVDLAILTEEKEILFDPSPKDRGELLIRCMSSMHGYYNRPEMMEDRYIKDQQGVTWMRSGDLSHIDNDGRIYIWGRQSNQMVFSNGQKVYPFDIAAKLCRNTKIENAIVMQREMNGKKQIVLHLDCKVFDQEIEDHIKQAISNFSVPKDLEIYCHLYPHGFPLNKVSTKMDYALMQENNNELIPIHINGN